MLNWNRRKWGKPLNNLTAITTKISLHHFWDNEKFILFDFFLPGDPPLNSWQAKAPDGSGKSKQAMSKTFFGFSGHFLGFTPWRIFQVNPQGPLTNIISYPYSELKFEFELRAGQLVVDIYNKNESNLKDNSYNSYEISEQQQKIISASKSGKTPIPSEKTKLEKLEQDWGFNAKHEGQVLIAKLAKESSGKEIYAYRKCVKCEWEGSELLFDPKYTNNKEIRCSGCLRVY
jgi:hypothetical protein